MQLSSAIIIRSEIGDPTLFREAKCGAWVMILSIYYASLSFYLWIYFSLFSLTQFMDMFLYSSLRRTNGAITTVNCYLLLNLKIVRPVHNLHYRLSICFSTHY